MLIDFTVNNFRSIRDAITLSSVAQARKSPQTLPPSRRNIKPDHKIAPTFSVEGRDIELLPVIGIFGANASGKSNVIEALDDFLVLIWVGAGNEGNFLKLFEPFNLSDSAKESPTSFRLRAAVEGSIFTLTLTLNRTRILYEKLEYIPAQSQRMLNRLLYERIWQEDADSYVFKNGRDFGNAYKEIQESLRKHEPFMSILTARLNAGVAEPFTSWVGSRWAGTVLGDEQEEYELAAERLGEYESEKLELVTQIIQRFDTGIAGIEIQKNPEGEQQGNKFQVLVLHEADGRRIRWQMKKESMGTQRLFSLIYRILDAFEEGSLLLVDELGSNIHPNITRAVVRMFQSDKTNPKRAQLIFTSHDNTLQRGNLLRRDQIWFTQKRANGSTELYPLSDFKPRNDLAIDKAYLEGRFGAVPILPDEEELLEPTEAR